MSIKRPIYLEPDKYSLLGFKMSPLTSFLCTFCVLLTLNGKLVDSEALPGRSIPSISDKTPHNLPSSMLSVGLQPAVDSLLANEPNCSRWIWGTCYFNHGVCGEGKQHATRSGDGCRIIGITSRCYKECGKNEETPYLPPSIIDDNIWGIDEDQDEKSNARPQPPKLDSNSKHTPFSRPKGFDPNWPGEDTFDRIMISDEYRNSGIGGIGSLDLGDDEQDAHCRWYKAAWGPCEGGVKIRVRKLRKNRKEREGLSCPDQKRDTKACGSEALLGASGGSDGINDSQEMEVPPPRLDAPCKWKKETEKCGKCDPHTNRKTCFMPLLSGNPATCGEERKFDKNC